MSAPPGLLHAASPQQVADTGAVADTLPDEPAPVQFEEEEVREALERSRPVQELLAIYRRMEGIRDVQVRLEGGILELRGHALSTEDRNRAAELAQDLPGVVFVDNGIEVETSLAKRLAPALDRLQGKGTAFLRFLPVFLAGFLIIGLTVFAAVAVGRPTRPYSWITPNTFAQNAIRQAVRTAVVLAGVLLALDLLGATALVGAVLGTAGLAGLAVGFAFRDIVENYLAGIILSLRQPFAPQDHVELSGHEGRVVRLTGRETVLMTLDGNHVRIPNSTVFKSIMTNFTRNPRRRFTVGVSIAPDEHLGHALAVGKAAISSLEGLLEQPAVTGRVHELGDSTVELRFFAWVDQTTADFDKLRSNALQAIKEAYETEGIATPAPEYGIRVLADEAGGLPSGRTPSQEPPSPTPPARTPAAPTEPDLDQDIAPDTTIEEEIARELATSDEENLLEPRDGPEHSRG